MLRSCFVLSLGVVVLGSCRKSEAPAPIQNKDWFSTFQPAADGYTIYGTTNQAQGWRYAGFRLNADGTYLEYGLGPADGPETRPGTWQTEGDLTYRITFQDPTRPGYRLRIRKPLNEHLEARVD